MLSFKPSMFMLYLLLALAGERQQVHKSLRMPMYHSITQMKLSLQVNFLAFAIPCIIAAIAIWFIQEKFSNAALSSVKKVS
ncbi:hypothetical protein ACQKIC_10520 [Peribacillus sp. NPDC046944]|uniref:hypothetical protein n=1 Tax=unclassified Peribacillus TaxID=2675266 RepID=UPI003D003C98